MGRSALVRGAIDLKHAPLSACRGRWGARPPHAATTLNRRALESRHPTQFKAVSDDNAINWAFSLLQLTESRDGKASIRQYCKLCRMESKEGRIRDGWEPKGAGPAMNEGANNAARRVPGIGRTRGEEGLDGSPRRRGQSQDRPPLSQPQPCVPDGAGARPGHEAEPSTPPA